MTDQELLQAMKAMLTETKQELQQETKAMLAETKQELRQEIMQDVTVLMDTEFKQKFNLLAEGQQAILDRLPDPEEIETTEHRLSVLELSVKKLNRELKELRAANG